MIRVEQNIAIRTSVGGVLYATTTLSGLPLGLPTGTPTVVLVHGFKGFRNWGFFPMAAQHLADAGFCVVRVDTSMNGMNGTNDRVIDIDAFAKNTPTREIDDIHELVEAMHTAPEFQQLRTRWNGVIHFVGHSRGGGAIHVVGRERTAKGDTTSRYVMWNSIGHWARWTTRQRDHWLAVGSIEIENTRTNQKLRLDASLLHDIEQHADRLALHHAAEAISDRALYIHATGDLTVPIREIEQLRSTSGTAGPLIAINGSTHSFGITHPIDHVTSSFVDVLHHTVNFLKA